MCKNVVHNVDISKIAKNTFNIFFKNISFDLSQTGLHFKNEKKLPDVRIR